jgi:hypothetical protein
MTNMSYPHSFKNAALRLAGGAAATALALGLPLVALAQTGCPTEGSGIVCTGGKSFCAANLQCYSAVSSCPNNQVTSCSACGCTCPSGTTLCSSTGVCMANVTCPAGTTWNVCTGECTTPFVLLSPTNPQSSADVKLNGLFTISGGSTAKINASSGTSGPNVSIAEFRHDNQSQGVGIGYASVFATGSNASQSLEVFARGTGNLLLNSSGGANVGIGTATPTAKLQVNPVTGGEGVRIISSNFSPLVVRNSSNTSDFFRVDQYGDVGIGTDSPTSKLDVRANDNVTLRAGDFNITNTIGSTMFTGVRVTSSRPTAPTSFGHVTGIEVNATSTRGASTDATWGITANTSGGSQNTSLNGRATEISASINSNTGVQGTAGGAINNYGVSGSASGGSKNYGLSGIASGGTTNYGVYAKAESGTDNNYAIYGAAGRTYLADKVSIGMDSISNAKLLVYDSDTTLGAAGIWAMESTTTPGTGVSYPNAAAGVKGYVSNGIGYHFGVAGYRFDEAVTSGISGGVMGGDHTFPNNWGVLGARDAAGNKYGGYFSGDVFSTGSMTSSRMCIGASCITSWPTGFSGTANYLTKFATATTLGNSVVYDDGSNVGIGTVPGQKLDVNGAIRAIDYGPPGSMNIIVGDDAFFTDIDQAQTIGLNGAGDTNTGGLRLGNAGPVLFGANGNLGIGTTSPQGKLHVSGAFNNTGVGVADGNDRPSVNITGNYPQIAIMAGGTGNTNHGATISMGAFDSGSSGTFKSWTLGTAGMNATWMDIGYGTSTNPHVNGIAGYGTTVMRLTSTGNVGIGTLTPTNGKLEVRTGVGGTAMHAQGGIAINAVGSSVAIRATGVIQAYGNGNVAIVADSQDIYGPGQGIVAYARGYGNGVEGHSATGPGLYGDGYYGINALGYNGNQIGYLSANGNPSLPALIISNPSSGSQSSLEMRFNDVAKARLRADNAGNLVLAGTGVIYIGQPDLGVSSDISFKNGSMYLNSTGLGIGTTAPGYKLDVVGAIRSIDYGVAGTVNIMVGDDAFLTDIDQGNTMGLNGAYDSNVGGLRLGNAGPVIFGVSGNLGIGTTNPAGYKLYVAGTTFSSGGYGSSDVRLKKDVETVAGALDKVERLRGVYFNWRTKEYPERNLDSSRQIGVIAQEVEKVVPELVRTDSQGYKAVSYEKLAALLVEAVKELDGQTVKLSADGSVSLEDINTSGDVSAPNNKWGKGSGWIACPDEGECACPAGLYVTKTRARGGEIYCSGL